MVVELAPVEEVEATVQPIEPQSGEPQSGEAQSEDSAPLTVTATEWEPLVIFSGTLTQFTEDGFIIDFDGQEGAFQASQDGDRLSMSAGDEHWEFMRDNQ